MTRQEYHEEAAACARMAEQTDDPTTRMVSAGLAQAWLQLARLTENDNRGKAAEPVTALPLAADLTPAPTEQS